MRDIGTRESSKWGHNEQHSQCSTSGPEPHSGAVAVLAAPVAAQAAPAPAAPAKAHTTIAGWGHNQSGGMPVQIHGNSITRHLTVKPGGVRTLEGMTRRASSHQVARANAAAKVLGVVKTNSKGKLTLTLPVHTTVDEYSVFARATKKASTGETVHWDVYKV